VGGVEAGDDSWQEKKAMRTVSREPAGRAVRKRPTGELSLAVWKR
jgi:hypothetical protein